MKGVDNAHEWRYALEKLKESEVRPGDDMEIRDELIESYIDEGIIVGKSRWAEIDEGHYMVNKLLNVSLLQVSKWYSSTVDTCVKLRDLVRDMAVQELRKKHPVMVEGGMLLREFPEEEKWTKNLRKVSIMSSRISEIPCNLSPDCPELSTLLLCENSGLHLIGDSFFVQFQGLKVLDVSYTSVIILPSSISDLVSLKALLAKWCRQLKHIPSLAKLRGLKKLDLRHSELVEMPQGMEQLSKLRYLNLKGTKEAEFPVGLLPNLSNLQVLILPQKLELRLKGMEVACLRKLEALECRLIYDVCEHSELNLQSLRKCRIAMGPENYRVGDDTPMNILSN